jgi:TolB-like protein
MSAPTSASTYAVRAPSLPARAARGAASHGAGVVFLLAVCTAGSLKSQCPDGTPPPCARPARVAPTPPPNSLAVLYFDNQSRDTSDAYLADGLTEEITTKLGQVGRLAVTSNTTMRRYRSADAVDPAALGRTLRVAQLVSGSVRRASHRIRVNVELLRARDGVQLWADAYDQTDTDLLALEETIARSVATAIAGRLLPAEQATLAERPTRNNEAYDHFLRGNFLMARRSPGAARRAVAEYQDAIALDLAFARAYGRLSLAYALFIDWGWPFPGLGYDSLLARAARAADHAVELDSTSADAWLARAYTSAYLHATTFAGAEPAFRRALALDPNNAEVHHQYASILMCLGRDSEAVTEFRRALALDPERAITFDNLAVLRYFQRQPAEALRLADSGLAVDPQAYYLYVDRANIRLVAGDTAGARGDAEAAARTHPPDYGISSEAMSATLQAFAGDTAGGRARIERALQQLPDTAHADYSQAQWLALGFLRAGAPERARAVLENVRPLGVNVWFIMRDPGFDPLRRDPRFQALERRVRPAAVEQ